MSLTVWSDYVCPFAYLGHLRLQRARSAVPGVAVEWQPFELHPETPPHGVARADLRRAAAAAGATRAPLRDLLDEDGVTLSPGPVQFNSRAALQAAEYARDAGQFDAFHDRLFAAAFQEGADLGRLDVLGALAGEVGLDRADLEAAVASYRYLDRVVEGVEGAMFAGVTGTPGYRTGDGEVLRGVQPVAVLEDALRRSRDAQVG